MPSTAIEPPVERSEEPDLYERVERARRASEYQEKLIRERYTDKPRKQWEAERGWTPG